MQEFDVLAVGNAIVDVLAARDEAFLTAQGMEKGSMRLIDAAEAERLHALLAGARAYSGGSAANTAAGIAALGGRAAFIGRVADDRLGEVFRADLHKIGVAYRTAPASDGLPTARCLITVTPDAQRTMRTFLGASSQLSVEDVDAGMVRAARLSYFEGYLWDQPGAIGALRHTAAIAREAGRQVALTLSDVFCVNGHRADFVDFLGQTDLLFANENEAMALFQVDTLEAAVAALAVRARLAVVTRSEKGAVVVAGDQRIAVPAAPVARVLDTTGAGDLFAAGFLAGFTRGKDLRTAAAMGTIAAGEIVEHYGARPEEALPSRMQRQLPAALRVD